MATKTNIKQAAHAILVSNVGDYGAKLYGEYYTDKTDDEICRSLEALLSELIGPQAAKAQLENLQKNK